MLNNEKTSAPKTVDPSSLGHTVGDRRWRFRWRSSWSARRRSGRGKMATLLAIELALAIGDRRARRFRWRSRRSGGHTVGDRVGKRMPLLPLLSLFSTFQDTVFIIPLKNRRNQNYFVQTNAFGSVKCTCAV